MGFSIVLFGTPLGYKYEKIDNPVDVSSCPPDSTANRFDSIDVHKLGLRPSEKIWVLFKQKTNDNLDVIGLALYQGAYESNQDRAGGYYGVGFLFQGVNCHKFEELISFTQKLLSQTSKLVLSENKHINDNYSKIKTKLMTKENLHYLMSSLNSLVVSSACLVEDSASLTPPYLYTYSPDISNIFGFLMKNQNHFNDFVCFGIDSPETKNSIEKLSTKKLYPSKDLMAQLTIDIRTGSIAAKEARLRNSYQDALNAKRLNERRIEDYINTINIKNQQLNQLELEVQSLLSTIESAEQSKQLTETHLAENSDRILNLKAEIKQFEHETGLELFAKPKPKEPTIQPEITSTYSSTNQNLVFPNIIDYKESPTKSTQTPQLSHSQQHQIRNSDKQHSLQRRSRENNNILLGVVAFIVILIIIVMGFWVFKPFFTQHNESSKQKQEYTAQHQINAKP